VGIGVVLGPSWRCREANSRVRVLVENIGTRATLVKMLDKYRRKGIETVGGEGQVREVFWGTEGVHVIGVGVEVERGEQ